VKPNIDYVTKHFYTAFELWYKNLWSSEKDKVRTFLIQRGDWWHTVPGLQEKIGVKAGPDGDLHLLPPKVPMSYEAAWLIYLKAETPGQKANRLASQSDWYAAKMEAEYAPQDKVLQAKYLAAKQVSDEYWATVNKALEQLGWVEAAQVAA
jgi:hypothetical protein